MTDMSSWTFQSPRNIAFAACSVLSEASGKPTPGMLPLKDVLFHAARIMINLHRQSAMADPSRGSERSEDLRFCSRFAGELFESPEKVDEILEALDRYIKEREP